VELARDIAAPLADEQTARFVRLAGERMMRDRCLDIGRDDELTDEFGSCSGGIG
jgi:hypothetical protein